MKFSILTVSDRCFSGETEDKSGNNLAQIVTEQPLSGKLIRLAVVPDDYHQIQNSLKSLCEDDVDVILTTGGTGCAPRDVTPEAVKDLIDKDIPGISLAMITNSLNITPMAMLSRPVCGVYKQSLVITLPGSKKASEECLGFITPALQHAVDLIRDKSHKVAVTHTSMQDSRKSKVSLREVAQRDRKSTYPLLSVEDAQNIIHQQCLPSTTETKNLRECLGYILGENVKSGVSIPPFPASIKDGYAVVASDGSGVRKVVGISTAGQKEEVVHVEAGTCSRISTGAALPPGADAVVQVEDTKLIEASPDNSTELLVEILGEPTLGQDIRPMGCDIHEGEEVLKSGIYLGPSELAILASIGHTSVLVHRKPSVGIMSTGDELKEPEDTQKSIIRDSNRTALHAILKQSGFSAKDFGILKDDPDCVATALGKAFNEVDVVITSGGVSMGERDVLKSVLIQDFDAQIHFARVFMKPGKPTTFATCNFNGQKKYILALPGNPVSCVVTSHLFVLPALKKLSSYDYIDIKPFELKVQTQDSFKLDPRPEYHRVTLCWDDGLVPIAVSTGNQLSSRLISMKRADALLMLPPQSENQKTVGPKTILKAILLCA